MLTKAFEPECGDVEWGPLHTANHTTPFDPLYDTPLNLAVIDISEYLKQAPIIPSHKPLHAFLCMLRNVMRRRHSCYSLTEPKGAGTAIAAEIFLRSHHKVTVISSLRQNRYPNRALEGKLQSSYGTGWVP
jgi:hypothetical protein